MAALSRVARMLGTQWAERTLSTLGSERRSIPFEWPGTGIEACRLVSACRDLPVAPEDCELLVYEVQRAAKDTWRELLSPE